MNAREDDREHTWSSKTPQHTTVNVTPRTTPNQTDLAGSIDLLVRHVIVASNMGCRLMVIQFFGSGPAGQIDRSPHTEAQKTRERNAERNGDKVTTMQYPSMLVVACEFDPAPLGFVGVDKAAANHVSETLEVALAVVAKQPHRPGGCSPSKPLRCVMVGFSRNGFLSCLWTSERYNVCVACMTLRLLSQDKLGVREKLQVLRRRRRGTGLFCRFRLPLLRRPVRRCTLRRPREEHRRITCCRSAQRESRVGVDPLFFRYDGCASSC